MKDCYGFHDDSKWVTNQLAKLSAIPESWFGALELSDVKFLVRLMAKLYAEDRLSGDEQRNIAQRLDIILSQFS